MYVLERVLCRYLHILYVILFADRQYRIDFKTYILPILYIYIIDIANVWFYIQIYYVYIYIYVPGYIHIVLIMNWSSWSSWHEKIARISITELSFGSFQKDQFLSIFTMVGQAKSTASIFFEHPENFEEKSQSYYILINYRDIYFTASQANDI